MSTETETPHQETAPKGKKYRLVVKSAEEAVGAIREKLGSSARVLSVRQMGGQGLSKFISSPKLEVIVELPENQAEDSADALISATGASEGTPQPLSESEPEKQEPTSSETQNANELLSDSTDISSLLERAGFDRDFLSSI